MKTNQFKSNFFVLVIVFLLPLATMANEKANDCIDTKMFGWLRKIIAPKTVVALVIEEHGREHAAVGNVAVGNICTKGQLLRNLMRTSLAFYTKDDVDLSSMGYPDLKNATNIFFTSVIPNNLPMICVVEHWKSREDYKMFSSAVDRQGIPASVFSVSATLRVTDSEGKALLEKAYREGDYKSSYSKRGSFPSSITQRALMADITRGAVAYTPLVPGKGLTISSVENTTWKSDRAKRIIRMENGGGVRTLESITAENDPAKDRWQQTGDVVRVWFNDGFALFEGRLTGNTLEGNVYSSFGIVEKSLYHLR